MKTNKYYVIFANIILSNFDIYIFAAFIAFIISAAIFKNHWLYTIGYIIATIGYSSSFIPIIKRKKEDERDAFLYYRANTYAFVATVIFLVIFILFHQSIAGLQNINIQNLLSIILCYAISSYNFFYIFLKRKY